MLLKVGSNIGEEARPFQSFRRILADSPKNLNGRGGGIRTHDFQLPKLTRCQAALHPAKVNRRERVPLPVAVLKRKRIYFGIRQD